MRMKPGHAFLAAVSLTGLATVSRGQSFADPATIPRAAASSSTPQTYGTVPTSYLTIFESQFSPFTSSVTYSDLGTDGSRASRFGTAGGVFLAPVNLPDGALLTSFALDACDSSTVSKHVEGILQQCDIFGNNCASVGTPIFSVSSTATPCAEVLQVGLTYTVNNLNSRVFLEVITQSLDNTNSISGALIGYKLQVSPAPVSATFNDVPPSNPFYQYVEALAASGITGGCGGGAFCPDSPVTRGQMAVFLAKALGLQFQ